MNRSPRSACLLAAVALCVPACDEREEHHHEHGKIVVTSPLVKDVTVTQQYVCQIHSQRHIEVCALENGYLEEIPVREGQAVKRGDVLFKIVPTLYQAKLDAELAEAQLAQIEFNNTKKLFEQHVVSNQEVALHQAKLAKALAKAKLAEAELNFTVVRSPYDGIVDRLRLQHGSLVKEGDILTTLSDNSLMWVYFNVPEARYLEYMSGAGRGKGKDKSKVKAVGKKNKKKDDKDDDDDDDDRDDDDDDDDDDDEMRHIDLVLADGRKYPHAGKIGAIEAKFNNETGNIPFRADFPNPKGLLRHGQTGNVLIHRTVKNAILIPQRATFEVLHKQYAYVVDKDGIVRQRDIEVLHELDDIFAVKSGLRADDKIILEGIRQVREGDKVEAEFRKPEEALANQKVHAE